VLRLIEMDEAEQRGRRYLREIADVMAFSSEVVAGSRQENASKQKNRTSVSIQSERRFQETKLGDDMDEILKFFPAALTRLSAIDPFLSVAIFCGVGMLASLLLLIFDQELFSTWAYP
jgi:hypothetical protein